MPDSSDQRATAEPSIGYFQHLLEGAAVGIAILDRDNRCEWTNGTLSCLLGYSSQELRGARWIDLAPDEDRQADAARFDQMRAGEYRDYQVQRRWLHKSGHVVWAVESACLVRDPHSNGLRFLCHVHPAAESKVPLSERLTSERLAAFGQMATGLAHEGRNALQQIGACAEMLAMEVHDLPEALDLVVGVQEAETRLHRMFEDLRAYASPLHLERRKCNLADLWRKAWAQLLADHPHRRARLTEDMSAVDVRPTVTANYLEKAFLKIFGNSLDASIDPVEVEVRCESAEFRGGPAVRVSVRDSGTGFTLGSLEKAFQPFYGTKTQGTGLGLAIVRRLIEAHGGQVHAENVKPSGARIEFVLPRDA